MILYLLDTDIVSYLMKRRFVQLQTKFSRMPPEAWAISSITYAEILFGLEAFGPFHHARTRAIGFLGAAQILDWPSDAAPAYAAVRYQLQRQPIGDRDYMIAAHAIALDATLVSNNIRHFGRIGLPLKLENWLE
jgi:tRNA(fMet)-specific endonuclease VapC